jgi:hypothetical protein
VEASVWVLGGERGIRAGVGDRVGALTKVSLSKISGRGMGEEVWVVVAYMVVEAREGKRVMCRHGSSLNALEHWKMSFAEKVGCIFIPFVHLQRRSYRTP